MRRAVDTSTRLTRTHTRANITTHPVSPELDATVARCICVCPSPGMPSLSKYAPVYGDRELLPALCHGQLPYTGTNHPVAPQPRGSPGARVVEGGADTRVSFAEGYGAKERVRGMKGNSGNTGDDEVDEKKKRGMIREWIRPRFFLYWLPDGLYPW